MISIIIPTLNEAEIIEKTLDYIFSQKGDFEVIVSDGGSRDETVNIIKKFPNIKLIHSPAGRAKQMNEGAKHASGEILLFLHADTFLMPSSLQLIEKNMSNPAVIAGSFYLKFDAVRLTLNFYSLFSRINHLLFTYGDQAIFIRKEVFVSLKGYKEMRLMEDVEIQQRLRKKGKFIKIDQHVVTSSRRFLKHGTVLQQIKNVVLVGLFLLGISPDLLKKYYKD